MFCWVLFASTFNFTFLCVYDCVSENNLNQFSFYHLGSEDQTQVARLGSWVLSLAHVGLFVVCYGLILFWGIFVTQWPVVLLSCLFGFDFRVMLASYFGSASSFISFPNNLSKLILIWSGVVHAFNPNTWRQRQEGLWVQGQRDLHSKFQDSQGCVERPCLKNQRQTKVLRHISVSEYGTVLTTLWWQKCH